MTLLFEIGFCQGNLGRPRGAPQIPPLRYATVGMTKGRVALSSRFDAADDEQQVPRSTTAQGRLSTAVGMILLFEIGVCQGNLGRFITLGCRL